MVGYLVLHDYHAWAVGLFAYAGITDLVDGYIARRWNLQTVVGTVIDPMADKTLMTILTVCLAVKGALPGMQYLYALTLHLLRNPKKLLTPHSMARSDHPWPRYRLRHRRHILPMDLSSATKDV